MKTAPQDSVKCPFYRGVSLTGVRLKANLDSRNSGLEIPTAHAHYKIPSEILQFR